jgi:MoaA/NifB/PqqE/SkfB family radical SAM enzyme
MRATTAGPITAEAFAQLLSPVLDLERLTLTLEIVVVCSLRCPGCWLAMERDDVWERPPARTMPDDLLEAALDFGHALGVSRLSLLGGEPTLHPDLPTIVKRARHRGYQASITTNGVCSPVRLAGVLESGLDGVSFSVDGSTPAIHDALRPSANGRSTFQRTLESIRLAVTRRPALGYRVGVNHTIYGRNLHDAEAMIRLSAELGVDHVRLHFSLPSDLTETDGSRSWVDPAGWRGLHARLPMRARARDRYHDAPGLRGPRG